MSSKAIICKYAGCKLILERPVTLPCGKSICKQHLEQYENDEKYKCCFCKEQHEIPKNGFVVNNSFDSMIQDYLYSNPIRKNIIKTFNMLCESVKNYDSFDSDVYIYDYFAEIRNKVDLHREELIKEVYEKSEEIIKQLKEKEEMCKLNAAKISKINLSLNDKIDLWKRKMRKVEKNKNELNKLLEELTINKENVNKQMKQIKNKLLLNENIEFIKSEPDNLFGCLVKKKNFVTLSTQCGELIQSFTHSNSDSIKSIQIDEKSNKLLSGSNDETIKIWDLNTGECLKTLIDHKDWILSILLIPDNKFISTSMDKTLKIWDLNTYECLDTLNNKSEIYSLCLLPNNRIAYGCFYGSINILNLDDLVIVKSLWAHDQRIRDLKKTNDNLKLISCSSFSYSGKKDNKIKVWSLDTFECIKIIDGHSDKIYNLELKSDGNLLSCSSDRTVKLWDIETGKLLKSLRYKNSIHCVKALNEELIAVSLSNGKIQIYNLEKDEKIKTMQSKSFNELYSNILLSNGILFSGSTKGKITQWKIFE